MGDIVLVEGNNELNVQLTPVVQAKFYMPSVMDVKVTDGLILGMYHKCEFSCTITNNGDATGTYTLTCRDSLDRAGGPKEITLAPGESYRWSTWSHIDFSRVSAPYTWELWGDWEENNYSRGEASPEMAVITPAIEIRAVTWDKSPPEFAPGTTHTAKATMRNPSNRPWDYTAILRMGPSQVAMASAAFHLDPGQSSEIRFSVAMPAAEGEYPVYLDVSSGGQLLVHQATESVVITLSWEFTGSLSGKCVERFIEGGCYKADINYSINGVAPGFRWELVYWDYGYTNTYRIVGNGAASGKIRCSGGARLYAHPNPNARMGVLWTDGLIVSGGFKHIASTGVLYL